MTLKEIKQLAIDRRQARWDKEAAAKVQTEKHRLLVAGLAEWKKVQPQDIKISNFHCRKAPADLSCVFVVSYNPYTNPCIFCGGLEDDVF